MEEAQQTQQHQRIKVYVRLRSSADLPFNTSPNDPHAITLQNSTYEYDHVGVDASQEDVWDVVGRPVADSCLEGYNGTILA